MDDSTLHIILTSALTAVGVVVSWTLLAVIGMGKDIAVLQFKVLGTNGSKSDFTLLAERMDALVKKLDEFIEKAHQ